MNPNPIVYLDEWFMSHVIERIAWFSERRLRLGPYRLAQLIATLCLAAWAFEAYPSLFLELVLFIIWLQIIRFTLMFDLAARQSKRKTNPLRPLWVSRFVLIVFELLLVFSPYGVTLFEELSLVCFTLIFYLIAANPAPERKKAYVSPWAQP